MISTTSPSSLECLTTTLSPTSNFILRAKLRFCQPTFPVPIHKIDDQPDPHPAKEPFPGDRGNLDQKVCAEQHTQNGNKRQLAQYRCDKQPRDQQHKN